MGCDGVTVDYRPDGLGENPVAGTNFQSALQTNGNVRFFSTSTGANLDVPTGTDPWNHVFVFTTATDFDQHGCMTIYGPTSSTTIQMAQPK